VTATTQLVTSGDITHEDTYDLGAGENTLVVSDGNVYGTVRFGDGGSALILGEAGGEFEDIGGTASVSFGVGDNVLWIKDGAVTGQASVTFAGGNNSMFVANNIDGLAQVEFNGDGENTLIVEGEIAQFAQVAFTGDGNNTLQTIEGSIAHGATVSFGNGDNTLAVGEHIASGVSISFGGGDNFVSVAGNIMSGEEFDLNTLQIEKAAGPHLSFGDGDNDVDINGAILGWAADEKRVAIEFGNGENDVRVVGYESVELANGDEDDVSVRYATLDFGDGGNFLGVAQGVQLSTIAFGDGDDSVAIGGNVRSSELKLGGGDDTVTVGGELHLSTIDMGDGDNKLSVGGNIGQGSKVSFGSGADAFLLAGSDVMIRGDAQGRKSIVDMGDGDDNVTIVCSSDTDPDEMTIVRSGAFLYGGEGNDTLTVRAVDPVELIARTGKQTVTLTFDGDYKVGDVVSVTIGEGAEPITYTVQASDIVQGDADATRARVASGLAAAIEAAGDVALSASVDDNVITLKGEKGEADVPVEAEGASLEVKQYADAEISGFETLNLVAENPTSVSDNDTETAEITADFDLIKDVEQLNLTSEVALRTTEVAGEGIVNGVYTVGEQGDVAVFNLNNLSRELSQSITVSANEVTATGNRQVERIWISGEDGAHEIGDVITVTIDGVEYSVTVTEDDLLAGDAGDDANAIAARLADVLAAGDHGFTVAVDNNVITLIGSSDEDVDVCFDSDSDLDFAQSLLGATPSDDGDADVVINAHLSESEDTDDDTLALVLDGTGNFDVAIDAEAPPPDSPRYENLVIDVQDEYSHTIDTAGDGEHREFAGGKMRLQGGIAGAAIVFNEVAAKEFTSTSEANVTVNFVEEAEPGEDWDYAYKVTTLGGDDTVDMSAITLTSHATIDLGDGEDRLVISNGRIAAATAIQSSDPFVLDRMFENVSNVEILEIAAGSHIAEEGEDEIVFDEKARDAGFEQVDIGKCASLALQVGEAFNRELSIKAARDVELDLTVYTDENISIAAEERLEAWVTIDPSSDGNLSVTAGDELWLAVHGQGSGDVNVEAGEGAYVAVVAESENAGAIDVKTGDDSTIHVVQAGTGAVTIAAGTGSHAHVSAGEGESSEFDISVALAGSNLSSVVLENISEQQNVSVQIGVHGEGEHLIANFDGFAWSGDDWMSSDYDGFTHLQVKDSSGGIDTLILTSVDESGEADAAGFVSVVVDDAWGAAGSQLTIDASDVVTASWSLEDLLGVFSGAGDVGDGAAGDQCDAGDGRAARDQGLGDDEQHVVWRHAGRCDQGRRRRGRALWRRRIGGRRSERKAVDGALYGTVRGGGAVRSPGGVHPLYLC